MKLLAKNIVLTGANRGIGRALIDVLLGNDVGKIYAIVRSEESADPLREIDARIHPLVADVTDRATVAKIADAAKDASIVINNAGTLDFGGFLDNDRATVERNMNTNFFGKLNMMEAFAPVLTANGGGAMVNVLTLVALASMPSLSV